MSERVSIFPVRLSQLLTRSAPREATVPHSAYKLAHRYAEFWKAKALGDSPESEFELKFMGRDEASGDDIYALRRRTEA